MYQKPVTHHDDGELRELTEQETSLIGVGLKIVGGYDPYGRFGGCPLPNDYRLGPFCTN
jgi:hypothetical protein